MGKQSRRKRQRSKRPSSSTAAPPNVEEESPSTLLQKLRHADPQTRHAALIALTCTLLHPEQLSSSNNANRVVSSDILNAVRELVLNENLECAHAAAKCCANFVQFGHRRDKSQLTAGWVLVFFQRLVSCHQALTTTTTHQRKQWLAVTVQSLTALCALVEMNPLALEYISEASNTDTIEFVPLVISLVKFAKETLETASSMPRSQDQDEYIRELRYIRYESFIRHWMIIHECCKRGVPLTMQQRNGKPFIKRVHVHHFHLWLDFMPRDVS